MFRRVASHRVVCMCVRAAVSRAPPDTPIVVSNAIRLNRICVSVAGRVRHIYTSAEYNNHVIMLYVSHDCMMYRATIAARSATQTLENHLICGCECVCESAPTVFGPIQ